ncbi:MAG: STAS domain-containing protein [Acidimicrobiales bacterium]
MAPAFEAATVHGDGQVVVSVSGELDIATADQLWQAIETATQRSRRLVIDLSRTTFIDSTGLSVLVRAHRRLGGAPEALTLRGPSALARKVLDISGISQMVTIEPSAT